MNLADLKYKKSINNTGFDNATNQSVGRVLNKDGSSNIKKTGIPFYKNISLFHTFIDMPIRKFLLLGISLFLLVNLFFGCIYYYLGTENLGIEASHSETTKFIEALFFSAQTVTTVGYGRVNPQSIPTGFVASMEAFFGLISFAVLTGLIYGRFSKPRAFLIFSKHALISPFKEGKALMFRLASYKYTNLTELEVELVVAMKIERDGKLITNYFPLPLDTPKVTTLALNWTLVHPITEESPIYGFTAEDLKNSQMEILVFFKAFDQHFANIVKERNSYHYSEIIFDAKFELMFKQSEDGKNTLLELDKIDDYKLV